MTLLRPAAHKKYSMMAGYVYELLMEILGEVNSLHPIEEDEGDYVLAKSIGWLTNGMGIFNNDITLSIIQKYFNQTIKVSINQIDSGDETHY